MINRVLSVLYILFDTYSYLLSLFLYLNNTISKIELQNTIVEYSLFEGKAKPANTAEFRKTVLEIENSILQISNKQACRSVKENMNENRKKL